MTTRNELEELATQARELRQRQRELGAVMAEADEIIAEADRIEEGLKTQVKKALRTAKKGDERLQQLEQDRKQAVESEDYVRAKDQMEQATEDAGLPKLNQDKKAREQELADEADADATIVEERQRIAKVREEAEASKRSAETERSRLREQGEQILNQMATLG